ncbi:MAG: aminoacetone oxidase family FAD-binding enzyme [Deltaproteobacteria bacterium]|nr:MAG: aminoacetone oxidase family FAD-binding enzyme [Deltaproteobacteria bacterium]
MKRQKTMIIGGGAAGLMAAHSAAVCGDSVLVLEKMKRTGRKIGISGKGRCNLTNKAPLAEFISHFGANGRFLRQCFQQFFRNELLAFFQSQNLPLVLERGGRYFPETQKALDVVRVFNTCLRRQGVEIQKNSRVLQLVIQQNRITGVVCNGRTVAADKVILTTGGRSYPRTGSTGDGYAMLRCLGHTIIPPLPALVPLYCSDPICKMATGLTLKNVNLRLFINGKRKRQEFGELSFTPTGVSGPAVLTISGQAVQELEQNSRVDLVIDLKPALSAEQLDARIIRDCGRRHQENIQNVLRGLLPQQLIPICLQSCQIAGNTRAAVFPRKQRKQLVNWCKNLRLAIAGYGSWDEAIVTAGGVSLKEIDPLTMESRLVKGLFVAGELLDLNADTGGFNLQAAFSTGWLAGSRALYHRS